MKQIVNELVSNSIGRNGTQLYLNGKLPTQYLPMTIDEYPVMWSIDYGSAFSVYVIDEEKMKSMDGPKNKKSKYDKSSKFESSIIAVLTLSKITFRDEIFFAVQSAYVSEKPDYKGRNIGYALYQGLISIIGIKLLSNGSHSKGAKKLWTRLSMDPKIKAYGFNLEKKTFFNVKPNNTKTELTSTADRLYRTDYDNGGLTGLMLIKRGTAVDAKFEKLIKVKPKIVVPKDNSPFKSIKAKPINNTGYYDSDY